MYILYYTYSKSGKFVMKSTSLFTKLNTPSACSIEFGKLVREIIKELQKNEEESLEAIKDICPYLSPKDDEKVLLFNKDQLKDIDDCNNIRRMFRENLRDCWRWDDFSLLEQIVKVINSNNCKSLLSQYKQSMVYTMKLQAIYECCKQQKCSLPEGYSEMVTIISDKNFYEITLKEYHELKDFTAKHCGVEPWFISPFVEASPLFSVLIKWHVPLIAVSHMIKKATENDKIFMEENFVYLKISSVIVFDKRDKVSLYVVYLCS